MAEPRKISVFECDNCGGRARWKRMPMPPAGKRWHGACPRCGTYDLFTARRAAITAADLRYVRIFGVEVDNVVDVTDMTELVKD